MFCITKKGKYMKILLIICFIILGSCASNDKMTISTVGVRAGSEIKIGGKTKKLGPGNIEVGDNFFKITKMANIEFEFANLVTIVSIVPSIDTPTCEEQTHILGETALPNSIQLITISRDLPFAQTRFAKEAKLENIKYYSDYKTGSFGNSTGLMIQGPELLARVILILDKGGIIRYMQIVDEITDLPDMKAAFDFAKSL